MMFPLEISGPHRPPANFMQKKAGKNGPLFKKNGPLLIQIFKCQINIKHTNTPSSSNAEVG